MLYEVLLRQTYLGQSVINRWHYNGSGTPASVQPSFGLAFAFGVVPDGEPPAFPDDTVFKRMSELQSVAVAYEELQVTALYDVEDFYVRPFVPVAHGLQTGTAMAPYEQYPFSSSRVRTDIDRGRKAVAGMIESAVGEGGVFEGGIIGNMNNLADAMSETLTYDDEGNTLTFVPCVLGFEKHTRVGKPPLYKKYATLAEQLDHVAQGILWSAKGRSSTQNTRKR